MLVLRGSYTSKEAYDALVAGLASFSDAPPPGLIVDVSESAMVASRPTQDIIRAARGLEVLGDRFSNRIGIVAPSTLAFGLMRMGGSHAERGGIHVRVCQTYAAAREWVLRAGDPSEE